MRFAIVAGALVLANAAPLHAQSVQYGPASAARSVVQSGSATAGDAAVWAGSGEIRDGGAPPGTVSSVGLVAPSWLAITGSPVTSSGVLSITGASEPANLFLGSPNGSAGAMTPREIIGTDLPAPGAASLGGIESLAAVAHHWLDSISTAGVPHVSQPSCGDLADAAPSCAIDTTNASDIVSGTLAAALLPTMLPANISFTGDNVYSGTSTWNGSLYVPIRVVTAAGPVTVSPTTDYLIVIDKTAPQPTTVNYTCAPGFTLMIKDGAGNDATDAITLSPASGTIDGAASFVMDASTAGTPPYEARAVTCDANGNSWVN
ncbi:MAG: hypothetical protein ACREE2_01005 [Stellaceae bacterium]